MKSVRQLAKMLRDPELSVRIRAYQAIENILGADFDYKANAEPHEREEAIKKAIAKAGVPARVDRVGSMVGLFFNADTVTNFEEAKQCNLEMFTAFYKGMLSRGVYLAPSQFEAAFVSSAHTPAHIDETVRAAEEVLSGLKQA